MAAVRGQSRGATASGHARSRTGGMVVMTGWLSLEALETTGQVTQIHARLTESATEKRNPAGQVEYGWSPARARRA